MGIYNFSSEYREDRYLERKTDAAGNVVALDPPDWCNGKELARVTFTADFVCEVGDVVAKQLFALWSELSGRNDKEGRLLLDAPETIRSRWFGEAHWSSATLAACAAAGATAEEALTIMAKREAELLGQLETKS